MMKMKRIYILAIASLMLIPMYGQTDTVKFVSDDSEELITERLDSLAADLLRQHRMLITPVEQTNDSVAVVEFPDSVYRKRLKDIHSVVALPYNSIVRNHIHVYTGTKRKNFEIMLGLREHYFPMIEDIFASYGLPDELKYLAVIESALNPNAVSRAGATGLWQFMYSTGRAYGLVINSVIDERRDPVQSTHAAARFLTDLYNIYNDWGLVIAAYNCGPGNVNKAIRRSGNRRDYWEIYYRLPRETRGYLPAYIAATYAMHYYNEHHIKPAPMTVDLLSDTVMIGHDMHIDQISAVLGIPREELRALNPQYRTGLIPGESKPMSVALPFERLGDFIENQDSIMAYRADHYFNSAVQSASPTASVYIPPDIKGKTKLIYTVKSGDNLGYIASWYNVGLSEIRYWNNIYRNTIRVGQKINVFVDPGKADYYAEVTDLSFEEKQRRIGKSSSSSTASASSFNVAALTPDDSGYEYYTVRNGDTVWDIAKKFNGVSTTDILSLNGLGTNSKIHVGQKLKIRRKS
jgi:membrane-bound lytic murein transglycosylase D